MAHEQAAVTDAGYDQARARAEADISILVEAYRTTAPGAGDQQATVTVGHLLAGREAPDLAGLLAAAVRLLARQGTQPGNEDP
jgi:hypothetical protein